MLSTLGTNFPRPEGLQVESHGPVRAPWNAGVCACLGATFSRANRRMHLPLNPTRRPQGSRKFGPSGWQHSIPLFFRLLNPFLALV